MSYKMALYGSQSRRIVVVDVYSDGDSSPLVKHVSSKTSDCSTNHTVQNGTVQSSSSSPSDHQSNGFVNGCSSSYSSPPPQLIPNTSEDFVTVVQVDETRSSSQEVNFVTVLQVGEDSESLRTRHPTEGEEVTIYRLPGERLGMALKFEGGMNSNENISRVFIQSINPGSPASRARSSKGLLREGDEIIKIDGRHVRSMTRLDCVSLLRDAPVCITMLICHDANNLIQDSQSQAPTATTNGHHVTNGKANGNSECESRRSYIPKRKKGPPPPIPPRKSSNLSGSDSSSSGEESPVSVREKVQLLEKHSVSPERPHCKRPSHPPPLPPQRRKDTSSPSSPQPEDSELSPKDKSPFPGSSVSMRLPGWEELMMRRAANKGDEKSQGHGDQLPVEPHVYMDLIAEEEEKQYMESESDDTGSSVSTVIERFSRASTANSSFSEHTHHSMDRPQPFDLEKVLSPFEQLERELDGEDPEDLPLDDNSKSPEDGEDVIDEGEGESSSVGITVVEPLEAELLPIDPPESFQDGVPVVCSNELPQINRTSCTDNEKCHLQTSDCNSESAAINTNRPSARDETKSLDISNDYQTCEVKDGSNAVEVTSKSDNEPTFNVVITTGADSGPPSSSSDSSISSISSDGGCDSDGSSSASSESENTSTKTSSDNKTPPVQLRPPPIPPRRGKIPLPITPATSSPDRPYLNREMRRSSSSSSNENIRSPNISAEGSSSKKNLVSRTQTVTRMEIVESTTSVTKVVKRKDGSVSAVNVSKKQDYRHASKETKILTQDAQSTVVKVQTAEVAFAEMSATVAVTPATRVVEGASHDEQENGQNSVQPAKISGDIDTSTASSKEHSLVESVAEVPALADESKASEKNEDQNRVESVNMSPNSELSNPTQKNEPCFKTAVEVAVPTSSEEEKLSTGKSEDAMEESIVDDDDQLRNPELDEVELIKSDIGELLVEIADILQQREKIALQDRQLEDIKEVDEENQEHQSDVESSASSLSSGIEAESSTISSSGSEEVKEEVKIATESSSTNLSETNQMLDTPENNSTVDSNYKSTGALLCHETSKIEAIAVTEEANKPETSSYTDFDKPVEDGTVGDRESRLPLDHNVKEKDGTENVGSPERSPNESPCVAESSGEAIPVKEPDKSISIDSKSEFQVESINDVLEDIDDDKTDVKNANKEDNLQISSSIEELSECLGDQINKETAANTEKPNQTTTVVEDGNSVLQSGNEEILSVCAMDKMTNISLFDAENNGSLVEDLPPPPFTRQPPDGHEFPHNCTDPVDIKRDDFKPVIGKVANDCSSSGSPTGLEDSGVFLDDTTPTHWKIANTESSTAVLLSDIPQEEFRKAYATTVSNESVTSLSSVSENILLNTCCNMRDNRELLRDYDDSSSRSDIATSSCSDSMDELDTAPFTKTKMDQTVPIPPPRTSIQPRNNYQESKPVNGNCQNGVESSSVVSNETITTQQRSSITVAKSSLKPASYALEKTTITTLTKNIELGGLPQLEFQKSAQKWKSEENLRFPPLTRYKGREEQASLSVKERIAMFSKLDSESAVSRNSEYRRTEDARIKHAYSTDMLAERKDTTSTEVGSKSQNNSGVDTYYKNSTKSTSPTNADLTKQQCLRSNSSSPPQGSLQYSAFSGLSKSTSNVALASQCKSTRENEFRAQDVPTALTKPLSLLTDFPDVRRDYQMISAYPQTQLSQYKRYSASGLTYASNLVTDDPLKRSVNSGSLLSILETRKEKATKLKGLIIPDKPNASSSARQTLPTIASYTPVVLPKSETPVSSHALQLVKADLSQPCSRVSQSLPRGFDFKSVSNAQKDVVDSAVTRQQSQPLLSEPPWKCNKASLPKYSPAFKRRTFELPRSTVSSSVSPTPPSSLTSPLSPPPSSPSSICSSTASSSTGAKSPTPSKHNIFQFSLSHSKPVTPLLPEKAIISPPPFSSSDPEESIPSRKTSTATAPDTDKAPPPLPRLPPPADNSASSTTNNHIFPPLPSRPSLEKRSPSTNSYSSATRSEANLNSSSMWSSTASSTSVPDVEHAKLVATCSDPRYSKSISNGTSPLLQAKESSNKYDGYSSRDRLSSEKETPLMKESIRMEYANQNDNSVLRKSASESDFLYQATYIAPSNGGSGYCEEGYRRRDVSPKDSVYSTALYTGSQMQVQHLEQRMVNVENGRQNVYSSQRSEIGRTYYRNDAFPDDFLESDEDTNSLCSQKTEDSMNRQLMIQDNDSSSDSLERALSPEFRPRAISQQKTVLRNNSDSTDSVKNFRALAEKWQLRSATDNPRDVKSPPVPPLPPTSVPNRKDSQAQVSSGNNIRLPPSLFPRQQEQNPGPERKSSITMPTSTNPVSSTTGSAVKMREPRGGTSTGQTPPLQRPTSLIETHDKSRIDSIWENSSNTNNITSNTSNYSRRHSTSVREFSSEYRRSLSSADSNVKDPLDRLKLRQSGIMASNKQNSLSVSDIRKAFESQQSIQNGNHAKGPVRKLADDRSQLWSSKENVNSSTSPRMTIRSKSNEEHHLRMSSIDSTTSEPDTTSPPSRFSSVGSLNNSPPAEQYGSVTSLASTTSLISPQELQQLIDEANQSLEEAGTPTHEIHVVVLHREMAGGSIGITLAGGADYEIKEITVHKVITGSIADKDGRIRKGDRIISINGRNLKGVSHREALEILKAPRPEVVLVLSRERSDPFSPSELPGSKVNSSSASNGFLAKTASSSDVSGIAASGGSNGAQTDCLCVQLIKDGAGLGFIIEGGKESPLGDRPLTIKRIFKGGIADRDGTLLPGDEIVSVNSQAVMNMTRTEAWNFMKKLPNGPVVIIIKRKS